MSLDILKKGFNLLLSYLQNKKRRKEFDPEKINWSFNSLSNMCEKEGFIDSSKELNGLGVKIIEHKEISIKDINEFKRIMAKTLK